MGQFTDKILLLSGSYSILPGLNEHAIAGGGGQADERPR
jgi:hypothetical protein